MVKSVAAQVVTTPNPLSVEGQRAFRSDIQYGDTLRTFVARQVEDLDATRWQIRLDGLVVEEGLWDTLEPYHGQLIEVVSVSRNNNVLRLVAFAVLMYFTMGAGGIAGGSFMGMTGFAGYAAATAAFLAGSVLINKVLPPVLAGSGSQAAPKSVYSLGDQRNQYRRYESMPILFGEVLIAPDIVSNAYPNYKGEDQFLNMILSPGFNVAKVGGVRIGDNPIANYDEVAITYSGFPAMPEQKIEQYTNVDVVTGGTLDEDTEVIRTTSADTIAVQIDIEYVLFDLTSKGGEKENNAMVEMSIRKLGDIAWIPMFESEIPTINPWPGIDMPPMPTFPGITFRSKTQDTKRQSFTYGGLEANTYEIRLMRRKQMVEGKGANAKFSWSNLNSIQEDKTPYTGIPRIGFSVRASGQFSGSVDQILMTATARPMPIWNGSAWVTATDRASGLSNPGAQMLLYAQGIRDNDGVIVGGMGLPDEMIDIDAIKDFMVHCANRNYTYDFWLNDTRNHDAALTSITLAGMGRYSWADGKLSVVWADRDQGPRAAVNMATCRDMTFQVEYSLANAADGIEYTYFNRAKWDTETIRIPAPGVTTMLQPAQITAEGVTEFDHALTMARYHLGQSLYQTKDIQFGTDIEALSYRQMSLVSLQHDLTQWGYGGRLIGFDNSGIRPKLIFDAEVPPTGINATSFVGVREPGKDTYYIMQVAPFTQATNEVTLLGEWPTDLVMPNSGKDYEAMQYLWCWDFKDSPGALVRVTGISFNSDYQTADVSCVIESDEFWNFVQTGAYIPPNDGSNLPRRPTVFNLKAAESNVITDNVVQNYLDINFDVGGFMTEAYVYVYSAAPGTARELAGVTRERKFLAPIPGEGVYIIRVQPYGLDGTLGVPAQIMFDTEAADAPPIKFDWFDIEDLAGGMRRYSWGYDITTIQPANLAGAQIRYIGGHPVTPNWDNMTPLGADGFHTAAFEDVLPEAGEWTFAIRAQNTAGALSETVYLTKTLGKNLGEQSAETSQSMVELFNQIYKETQDRVEAITYVTDLVSSEVQNRIEAVQGETQARLDDVANLNTKIANNADALLNEKLEREAAITNEAALRQSGDQSLAYQISQIVAGTGQQFDSKKIWYFDTTNEGWNGTSVDGSLNPGSAVAQSPSGLDIEGNQYRYIKMRVKRVGTPTWLGKVSWSMIDASTGEATLTEPDWDNNNNATIDLDEIEWTGSTLDSFAIQLGTAVDASNYYLFDWIAVGRPTPGASVAMVEEETRARIEADAAEASQRNTLAVQMRGDYEGTDVAELQQGIIYNERTARINGDEVNAQSIESLQVRADGIESSVTTETQARIAGDDALASQITALNSELEGKADASALQSLETRVTETEDGVTALSQSVTRLDAQLDGEFAGDEDWNAGDEDVYAGSLNVYTAIVDNTQAIARQINQVQSEFGEFQSHVNQQIETISNEVGSQASAISALQSEVAGKASSEAVQLLTTRVSVTELGVEANANAITQINTSLDGKASVSALTALQTQVSDINGQVTANANAITNVNARVDGKAEATVVQQLSATVTTQNGVITSINAQYFLAVDVNGRVGGMKIGNNGATVDFDILADRLRITSPNGGRRFEYSSGNIRIYDENNVLRVRLGIWD